MKKSLLSIPVILGIIVLISGPSVIAQSENNEIPAWVKGLASFWVEDKITDIEFIEAIEFLIDSDIIKIGTNNKIINSPTFDCAKQWDKFQENYNRLTEINIITTEQMQRVTEKLEGSALELFNNECASTVNGWANRTYDEGSVWMMKDQWKTWGFLEQKMKEDNLTFIEAGQKYLYNTESVSTKVMPYSESNSKCGAGTVFDEVKNACILEDKTVVTESVPIQTIQELSNK